MKSIEHYEQLAREAKAERRCRHAARHISEVARTVGNSYRSTVRVCTTCGKRGFAFGPASDTIESLVEIRAAELALDHADESMMEWAGCVSYKCGASVQSFDAQAGWLGAAILNHDAEQAETGGEG